MKALKDFTIVFSGLSLGHHEFSFALEDSFFDTFEYERDFTVSKLTASVGLLKSSTVLELRMKVEGQLELVCDLSTHSFLEDLTTDYFLPVNFSEEFNDENPELLILPHGAYELNVARYLFEMVILALPRKRIHPKVISGEIGEDMLDLIEKYAPKEEVSTEDTESSNEIDPRWSELQKLKDKLED